MTFILGLSVFYHDSATCLFKDGEILAAAPGSEQAYDNMHRTGIIVELWAFMRVRKKWWLLPVLVVLLLVGILLVFAETSALAPFIYTVF